MIIERFDLKAFGRFTNASLDFKADEHQFHVVFGPNESGKSTCLRAITSWLFGIDGRSTDNYVHAYSDLRVGGKIVSEQHGTLECMRRKGRSRTLKSIDESSDIDESRLARMLGGINQETFLKGFGLDRQRLIEGGQDIMRGEGDLGQILFAAGVGMQSLSDVVTALEKERRALFLPSGSVPELNKSLAELKKLRAEMSSKSLTSTEWKRRGSQLEDAKQHAKTIGERRAETSKVLARSKNLQHALPLAVRRRQLVELLNEFADVPLLDDDFRQRRRSSESELQVAAGQLVVLEQRLQKLDEDANALPEDYPILQFADRIDELVNGLAVSQSAEARFPALESLNCQLDEEIAGLLKQLGHAADVDIDALRLTDVQRQQIQDLSDEGVKLGELIRTKQESAREATRQLETLQQSIAEETPEDPVQMAAVLQAYSNPQRLLDDARNAATEFQRLTKRMDGAFKKLVGFQGSLEQAIQLQLPLPDVLSRRAEHFQTSQLALARQIEKQETLEAARSEHAAEIAGLKSMAGVPSEHELLEARQHRDRLLAEWGGKELNRTVGIERLQGAVREADRLADAMRSEAEMVARRAQAEAELVKVEHRLQSCREKLKEASANWEAACDAWNGLWNGMGIEPSTPADMQQWATRHEAFLEIVQQQRLAKDAVGLAERELNHCAAAFRSQLEIAGPEIPGQTPVAAKAGGLDVMTLHAMVGRVYEDRKTAFQQSVEWVRDKKRVIGDVKRLERERADAENALEVWQRNWKDAIGPIASDTDATPPQVRQRIATIDLLLEKRAKKNECQRELESLRRGASQLNASIASLRSDLGEDDTSSDQPHVVVERLRKELALAAAQAGKRNALIEERERCAADVRGCRNKILACQAKLETLCREVGSVRADQLPELERKAVQKRELMIELAEVERGLAGCAAGQDLNAFANEVLECDADDLDSTIEGCESELTSSEASWEAAQQQVGALQQSYNEMDGSGDAAEVNQQIQNLEAKAAKVARRYALLTIQAVALDRAIEAYREQNQGPILERATEFFKAMTCGDYCLLKPYLDDKNQRILVGVRGEVGHEVDVKANLMSEGTADALFLSLRLAGLEMHVAQHSPVPLIVDDVLVQFDDTRSVEALKLLCELSRKIQVIFFTHHLHAVDLVKQSLAAGSYKIHNLQELS